MEKSGLRFPESYQESSFASRILGYTDPSSLAQLLRTYQIMTPKIGSFGLEVQKIIRETFQLDEKDSKATFIPYEGILIAGMQGTTPSCGSAGFPCYV
ncbi:hypothetical protein [Candidatus Kuenenia sp.]|uniref:hypothetical protein n=1 Tax=Candidatus Kuenenia sp. TaxID=2499824 RepID=UPI00321FBA8C